MLNDKTISPAENTIKKLISTLEQDSKAAIDWFKVNEMILNPDKFQAIVGKKNFSALNINKQTINSENCVKLLGIEKDNTLSFDKHMLIFAKKQAIN